MSHHTGASLIFGIWDKTYCSTIIVLDSWQQFCQTNTTCLSQKGSIFNIVFMLKAFPVSVYWKLLIYFGRAAFNPIQLVPPTAL